MLRAGQVDEDRWERERRIKWLDLEKLRGSRVLVIGAGALGNEAVKDLVLAGIGHITLVDMDHVVRSNLSRCVLFRERDHAERRLKAEAVAERAVDLDPGASVTPVAGRVEDLPPEVWKEHHLVLGCLDNVAARLHVNSHAYFHGVPYVDGGTDGFSGRVQVVVPPATPCLQCGLNRTHYKILEKRYSCTGAEVAFYQPKVAAEITTTSIVAAVQVREAIKLLCGLEDRTIKNVLHYDGLRGRWDELELSFDPECPMHSL